jgi:excisionase family DNA binding protein
MPTAKRTTTLDDLAGRNFATVGEVAAILEYDARTIRKGITDGVIPAVRAGATFRIPVAWLRSAASAGVDLEARPA